MEWPSAVFLNSPSQGSGLAFNPISEHELNQLQEARYDKLIKDESERQVRLALPERQNDFVRTEAARLARPRAWLAVSAFAYLTVVGVVVPLTVLAWQPVWSGLLRRRSLVGLFVSWLLFLSGYLIWAIRQLTGDTSGMDNRIDRMALPSVRPARRGGEIGSSVEEGQTGREK